MSLTKRYLESLPAEEQDAILGRHEGIKEHAEDVCECGDYRKQHPNGGACNLNGLGHGMPMPAGDCSAFRLAYSHWGNHDPYDEWTDDAENEPDEELAELEWARALMEEAEEADRFAERDEAPLVKSQPPSVKAGCFDI